MSEAGGEVSAKDGLAVVPFSSREAFAQWLASHHDRSPGIWLKLAKQAAGVDSVTYREALDAALCFGWIDGQRGRYDERFHLIRFTPRKSRSKWSKINCAKALALIDSGEMQPAGLREVHAAQGDGRWEAAYQSQRTITVPPDLQAALDADPAAREFFATVSSQNRYAILYRIQDAVRPQTRQRRIAQYVAMLAEGRTLHP